MQILSDSASENSTNAHTHTHTHTHTDGECVTLTWNLEQSMRDGSERDASD